MNTLSTITIMPENKASLEVYKSNLKSEILAGNENPLRIAKVLKSLEETIKFLREDKEIREAILNEAMKYGAKTFETFGVEFQIKEVGVKYDFTACDDQEWNKLQKEYEILEKKIEVRETFLKSISPDQQIYDENGVQLLPPAKKSTTSVTVKLK